MGIMHKLLKRRDLECKGLIMDLTISKDNATKREQSDIPVHEDEDDDDLAPRLATDDNQFTAEHIVQLCKFLAEKSTRNKTTHKRLLNGDSPRMLKIATHHNQREVNSKHDRNDAINHVHENDEFLLEASKRGATQILTDKLITNSNACSETNQKIFSDINKNRSVREKRDILLKIRHQIFERKRQRQLMEQQLDVWRPW